MSQLLSGCEGVKSDTKVDLVVEGDVVEESLQVRSKHLIIGESVTWNLIQVLLKSFSNLAIFELLEVVIVHDLTLDHTQVTI